MKILTINQGPEDAPLERQATRGPVVGGKQAATTDRKNPINKQTNKQKRRISWNDRPTDERATKNKLSYCSGAGSAAPRSTKFFAVYDVYASTYYRDIEAVY